MLTAYKEFWRRYADFEGRSTRSEFWYACLANILIVFGLFVISIIILLMALAAQGYDSSNIYGSLATLFFSFILFFGYALAAFIPNIAIAVRRLRDAGYHWGFVFLNYGPTLLSYVPGLSIIAVLVALPCQVAFIVLLCQPTKYDVSQVNNSYNSQGAQPYGQAQGFGQNNQNFNQDPNQAFAQNNQNFNQEPVNQVQNAAQTQGASQPFPQAQPVEATPVAEQEPVQSAEPLGQAFTETEVKPTGQAEEVTPAPETTESSSTEE